MVLTHFPRFWELPTFPPFRKRRLIEVLQHRTKAGWQRRPEMAKASMQFAEVTCPTCFEVFEVAMPHPDEMPTEVDYDCEICCRPMVIVFTEDDIYAKGLAD
jgi:phage FluMu protein Com